MKKILVFILTVIIIGLIGLLCVSFSAKKIMVNNVSNIVVKKEVANVLVDNVRKYAPSIDYSVSEELEYRIMNSDAVTKIAEKYFDNMVDSIVLNDEVMLPDAKEELKKLIEENREFLEEKGISVPDEETINGLIDDKRFNNTYKNAVSHVQESLSSNEKEAITLYDKFISDDIRTIIIISILVCILFIALLKFSLYKWMIDIGIACVVDGILIVFIVPPIVDSLVKRYVGSIITLNLTDFSNCGYVCLIPGIVLILMYLLIKKLTNKKVKPKKEHLIESQ